VSERTDTILTSIWNEAIARLETIQQADGFNTDAGSRVYMGATPELGPDDPEAVIAIVVGDDTPTFESKKTGIQLPFEVQAVVKTTADDAWMLAEMLAGDIKKAMETSDRRLFTFPLKRLPTRTIPREPGSNVTGKAIGYQVEYSEPWGHP
jgi:hypothetical protein